MSVDIPANFDEDFLNWFRERTEAAWAALPSHSPDDILAEFVEREVGGCTWQQSTRWLSGLSEEEIAGVEQRWALVFPPDYRRFLRSLHTVSRPRLCARYQEKVEASDNTANALAVGYIARYAQHMVVKHGASFYNWLTDTMALGERFAWLWEGLQFDVEYNSLWLPSWGPKPTTLGGQKRRVRELVEAAPKLIPIFEHRYLLAEPCVVGNPVLSVWQSDIIIYGANLRDYLLVEFADLLGLGNEDSARLIHEIRTRVLAHRDEYATIPFWGELCSIMMRGPS